MAMGFNLSILECKGGDTVLNIDNIELASFNLSILECKGGSEKKCRGRFVSFNLNILECKAG